MRHGIGTFLVGVIVASFGASDALGASSQSSCPGGQKPERGCHCWKDAGILKMACPGDRNAASSLSGATPERSPAPARADRKSPSNVRPVAERPDVSNEKWLTKDEIREKLVRQHESLDDHLLKVQRARFVAKARGESADVIDGLEEEFADVQAQRRNVLTKLKRLDARH